MWAKTILPGKEQFEYILLQLTVPVDLVPFQGFARDVYFPGLDCWLNLAHSLDGGGGRVMHHAATKNGGRGGGDGGW